VLNGNLAYGDIDGMIYVYEHDAKVALFLEVVHREVLTKQESVDIVSLSAEDEPRVFVHAMDHLTHLIKFATHTPASAFALKVWSTKAGWQT
jgi:hypothetical protein